MSTPGFLAEGTRVSSMHSGEDCLPDNQVARAAAACGPCPALICYRVYGRHREKAGDYGWITAADRAQERVGARPAS